MSFRRLSGVIVSITAVLLWLAGTLASQPKSGGSRTILFSVIGKDKHPITDLKLEEVKVFENGKAQNTASIANASAVPLTLVMLVDASGSTVNVPPYWRSEMKPFLDGLLRPGVGKGAVIHFSESPTLIQAATDNVSQLVDAINKAKAGGGSAVYDSLAIAAREAGKSQGRKAILMISDGEDNASRFTKEMTSRIVQENDVIIYAITVEPVRTGTPFLPSRPTGKPFLEELTRETGGRYLTSNSPKDLRNKLVEVGDELRSQYAVTYQPSDSKGAGAWRKLKIEVSRKDSRVQHRSGYYSTP